VLRLDFVSVFGRFFRRVAFAPYNFMEIFFCLDIFGVFSEGVHGGIELFVLNPILLNVGLVFADSLQLDLIFFAKLLIVLFALDEFLVCLLEPLLSEKTLLLTVMPFLYDLIQLILNEVYVLFICNVRGLSVSFSEFLLIFLYFYQRPLQLLFMIIHFLISLSQILNG
jgi:hypothetical protein